MGGFFFFALPPTLVPAGITVVTTPGSPGTASTRLDHSDSRLAPWHRYSGYKYETLSGPQHGALLYIVSSYPEPV